MAKREQQKHPTLGVPEHRRAQEASLDGKTAQMLDDVGILVSSEEARRLVQDLNGRRQRSGMRTEPHEAADMLQAEAAEFAQLVIRQARRRSRLAIQLAGQTAKRPARQARNSDSPRRVCAEHIRSTRMEALMLKRPELAAEVRFLIDPGLQRDRQPSMRELHVLLLTRLREWQDPNADHGLFTSGLGYAAFCAWVRHARISGREDL